MSELQEQLLQIEEGCLVYSRQQESIVIKRYSGIGKKAVIPASIEGLPVTTIDKKAFLSCKTLKEIELPNTLQELGDWAFAHAEYLRLVTVPRRELVRGKDLFLGCKRLREIRFIGSEQEQLQDQQDGIGRMLALAVTVLQDYLLFTPTKVRDDSWIASWDEKLLRLVETDDLEGFEELWTCGEEDYEGKDYDIKSYPVERRKGKLRMVYFRLLHPYKLSEVTKEKFQNYVKEHTKGTKEPESWEIIIEEHPQDITYYQVFAQAGGINENNFSLLLEDMQEVNAQMKAFLFRYQQEHLTAKKAFEEFELDW